MTLSPNLDVLVKLRTMRIFNGYLQRPILLCSALLAAACSPLKPVDLPPEYTPAPTDAELWTTLADERPGEWYVLLNDGPGALDWRLRAIDSATESIDLQTFLWSVDTVGSMVLDHLVAAAERGVEVKLLVDDSFLLGKDDILLELVHHPNIEYRVYNPYKRRSNNVVTRQALNLAEFHRLDHRMHNKAMIVDNRIAIVGGRNLADEYFGLHAVANFRDLEVMVGGPIVLDVSAEFDNYWNDRWAVPVESLTHVRHTAADLDAARDVRDANIHIHAEQTGAERLGSWRELISNAVDGTATLFADKPPEENPAKAGEAPVQVAHALMQMLDAASEEVLIVSAYLIPTPELEGAVERAVNRGVRIRMLTNSIRSNNHLTAHSAYRNHIRGLLDSGAELHEVRIDATDRDIYMLSPIEQKQLALHAKALVIDDDKVFIGSANLDPRSLRINTEMGFLIESEALNAEVRDAVTPDFSKTNSWQLQIDEQRQSGLGVPRRHADRAARRLHAAADRGLVLLPSAHRRRTLTERALPRGACGVQNAGAFYEPPSVVPIRPATQGKKKGATRAPFFFAGGDGWNGLNGSFAASHYVRRASTGFAGLGSGLRPSPLRGASGVQNAGAFCEPPSVALFLLPRKQERPLDEGPFCVSGGDGWN